MVFSAIQQQGALALLLLFSSSLQAVVRAQGSNTIVIGKDVLATPSNVGWMDGVCYKPITQVAPGDKLEFNYDAHNVYQMASKEHFDNCDFEDSTLTAQFGESPATYTVPEDTPQGETLYFACYVADHCGSGTQKVQVQIADGFSNDFDPESNRISGYFLGLSTDECNDVQNGEYNEAAANEGNTLPSVCTDPEPVEGEPNTFYRTCLSSPITLTPGGVVNRLYLLAYPFPTDYRVLIGQRTFEYVTGSFEDGITPVPHNQLYVHHLSGLIVFGQGAEGLRNEAPDAPFNAPYGWMSGDEGDFFVMHLIDLREVDDWLSCIECRCPVEADAGTYLDELGTSGNITGGVNCCSNCTSLVGPTVDYKMRYNITYTELTPDSDPVANVQMLTADISPAVGMILEHDVPSWEYLPDDQRHPDNPKIQRLVREMPFNELFKMEFFQGNYDGAEEVRILRCVAHLHVASVVQYLEDAETGEMLCMGNTVYGTDPDEDEGFLTAVTVDNHDPPLTIPADRVVRFVTDYNATTLHTGVMGYWFVFVDSGDQVTVEDVDLKMEVCVAATCDAALLPSVDMAQFQPETAIEASKRQANNDCADTLVDSPSCTFGGLCECEDFVNAEESSGCDGFYSSPFGDIEVRSLCAKYCGCDVAEAVEEAMTVEMEDNMDTGDEAAAAPAQTFSNCEDKLVEHPACRFGGMCDCAEFVGDTASTGCGGVYVSEMGDIQVNDVCAQFCGDCQDVSMDELFAEVYFEAATMQIKDDICKFSTAECQATLNNMVACAEGQPGAEDLDPLVRMAVEKHGHELAKNGAKLGDPSLHAGDEEPEVGACPGVEITPPVVEEAEEAPQEPAEEEPAAVVEAPAPAPASSGDCTDTLSSHPACRFGGLCDCKRMVAESDGYGCNGVYRSNMGDIAVLSVCASYCGCPGGQPPAVEGGGGPSLCFSGDSEVNVLGKGTIPMKELQVGDSVLGSGNSYEQVYGFAHYEPAKEAAFLNIQTNDSTMEVTGDHLVYANDKFVPAKSIVIGDTLQMEEGAAIVTKIKTVQKRGLYAPLTPSGTLLVNGLKVSSYVTLTQNDDAQWSYLAEHDFMHMMMTPYRFVCMGIAPKLCGNNYIDAETGYPAYVGFWIRMARITDRLPFAVQMILLVLAVLVFAPLLCLESVFGASLATTLLALAGAAPLVIRSANKERRTAGQSMKLKMA